MNYSVLFYYLLCFFPTIVWSQAIDHYEAAVLAEDVWSYRRGDSEPPGNWGQPGFNDASWETGEGGFGYGDGDDNTLVVAPLHSVYLRKEFTLTELEAIADFRLYADYDDAFVAYFNGVEIARANIGSPGVIPPYDATAITDREALLYQGGLPQVFPISLDQLTDIGIEGTNTLAIQVHNVGLGSSDFSALFYILLGINDDSNNYQAVPDWFVAPFTASTLPLFLVNTNNTDIPDEPKIDALLGIIDNGPGNLNTLTDEFNGYNGHIGIETRGSSSLFFDKKSYSFETRDAAGENNNVEILGMPSENDWILYGPYSDKSLMRNVLSYHIGDLMGRYAPRTRWCELFIDGQYMGVYVVTEKIKRDNNRVDIDNLQVGDIEGDELTGGYIFSVDRDEQGPESGWYSLYTDDVFYKFQDPDYDELVAVQKDYITNYFNSFEAAMEITPSPAVYEEYIDVPSWIDYWIATEVFKHIDNFKFSFYMYKKKDSNGGKIHFGPLWDLNLAYGNFDFAQDPGPVGWSYIWANQGFLRPEWVISLTDDPSMQNQINCRWTELRQAGLHTDSLFQFIDDNAALLEDAQARNFERWPILGTYVWPNSFIGDSYEQEIDFLKDWLLERLNWMDANMLGNCDLVSTEYPQVIPPALLLYPNPIQQQLTVYLEGPKAETGQLILLDALGRIVLEETLECRQAQSLSVGHLAAGLYFYQLSVDGQLLDAGRLVKE